MSKQTIHALIWSEVNQCYTFTCSGQPELHFPLADEEAFSCWLNEQVSFAFEGQEGRVSVLKETRPRGTGYWYAYRTQHRHTHKRYLGRSEKVTLTRLEEVARELTLEISRLDPLPITPKENEKQLMLLMNKLSYPRLPNTLVERGHLLYELNAALSYRLTLVSASAGSGKTTLLAAWAASLKQKEEENAPALAWLSLDALDNDQIRFWDSVITALNTCLPTIGKTALAMLHATQSPPLTAVLASLLNELKQVQKDVILILDDYHVITEQVIHEALLFLVEQCSTNIHLVLATRTDPALPLARWRVCAHLFEMRDSDLRFTQAETNQFLTKRMNLPLEAEEISTLHQRTEGWIAGLQLAALSMRKHQDLSSFVRNFTGSHRFLLDYIQHEILIHLPSALQTFLLQTSILTGISAPLCQAVTALPSQRESQEIIETLERANLFVVPLDEQGQWYRFHDLFRQALLARLYASQPERVPSLHQRAAHWYSTQGALREGITHALAAPDYPLAVSLIEQAAPQLWLSGEAKTVHSWIVSLPDAVLRCHLRLALNAALRLINAIHLSVETAHIAMLAQVEQTLTHLRSLVNRPQIPPLSSEERMLVERRLRLLMALIEVRAILKYVDEGRLRHLAQEVEELPPDDEISWNMISLTFHYWLTFTIGGQGALLIPRLLAMKQQGLQAGDHLTSIRVMYWLAMAYEQAGQFHQAQLQARQALALIEQTGGRTAMAGYPYYSLFTVYYAWNLLDEAADWLECLLVLAQDWHQVELLAMGKIALAELAMAQGELKIAEEALYKLEPLIKQEGFANHTSWFITTRIRWWLAQGNLQAASEWAAQTAFSPETWEPLRKFEVLLLIRVFLEQQQFARALEVIEAFKCHLDRPADSKTTIQFLTLQVIALHQRKQFAEAQEILTRLLEMTGPANNIRVYLDAGRLMQQALLSLQTPRYQVFIEKVLSAFEPQKLKNVREGNQSSAEATSLLSQQERKVLQLLIAGRTYAEMAEDLIVSINTIKTHMSNIYRKLGVTRRAEAIATSQRLRLL